MATLSVSLTTSDQTKNINYPSGSIAVTTGDGEQSGTVTTGSEDSIAIDTQITAGNGPGVVMLRNLSTTAAETIEISFSLSDTATYPNNITLNAQDGSEMNWAIVPLKDTMTKIFHTANSGTPQLWYHIFERGA